MSEYSFVSGDLVYFPHNPMLEHADNYEYFEGRQRRRYEMGLKAPALYCGRVDGVPGIVIDSFYAESWGADYSFVLYRGCIVICDHGSMEHV